MTVIMLPNAILITRLNVVTIMRGQWQAMARLSLRVGLNTKDQKVTLVLHQKYILRILKHLSQPLKDGELLNNSKISKGCWQRFILKKESFLCKKFLCNLQKQ